MRSPAAGSIVRPTAPPTLDPTPRATHGAPVRSAARPRADRRHLLLPVDRRSRRILLTALAVLPFVSIGFPVWLSGRSMEPALADGSLMFVDRLEPELLAVGRGDIVVFSPPPHTAAGSLTLTKRVIGLPGDVVTVGDGRVTVNGVPLLEPYLDPGQRTAMQGLTEEWRIPSGEVFVLGDARGRSLDSRSFGPVPISRIVGRVWLVLPTPFGRQ